MLATANGHAILHGTVVLPLVGVWPADLTIDTAEVPTGAVTIAFGGQTLIGTVVKEFRSEIPRAGAYAGTTTARVVGGAGGLSKVLPAKKYRYAPMSIVLADIMAETGETLSSTTDSAVLTLTPTHYARARAPATHALAEVLYTTGASWRVLPDGSIWLGTDTYPAASFSGDVLQERLGGSKLMLSPDDGSLLPGTTFRGRKIAEVVYHFSSSAARAEAWAA